MSLLHKQGLLVDAWYGGSTKQLIPCECKHGRQFEKLMREESPPTQTKPSPVDAEASTDNNVAKEV